MSVYLVWSNAARGWWGANGCGYEYDLWQAGRFTEAQAIDMCGRRTWEPGAIPPEVMVAAPENDQETFSVGALRSMPETMQARAAEATKQAMAERRRASQRSGEAS